VAPTSTDSALTPAITIVGGHEMGETITDQFPSTGWLDSAGAENGDKCAWITSGQGGLGGHLSLHRHVRGAVSLEQCLQQRLRCCVLSYP